ncbi:MAG: hypothetical protein ACYCTE_16485 [Acidimicrobiales bacterium]
MAVAEQLRNESEAYEANKGDLVREHLNKFVLIHDSEVLGTYESEGDALAAGYDKLGNVPFLVKLVEETEAPRNYFHIAL